MMWKKDGRGSTPCSLVGNSATFENFWDLLSTLQSGSTFLRNFRPVIRHHILEDGILQEGSIFIVSSSGDTRTSNRTGHDCTLNLFSELTPYISPNIDFVFQPFHHYCVGAASWPHWKQNKVISQRAKCACSSTLPVHVCKHDYDQDGQHYAFENKRVSLFCFLIL